MKILIKDVENKLSYKLKKNFKSVGVDTATTTGLVFLNTDSKYLYIDSLVISFKTKNSKEIYETMVKTFEKLFTDENIGIVEEVFVGFSRAGSVELAKFGAFAISSLIRKNIPYETLSATSARSKFKIDTRSEGKGKSKVAVDKWIKSIGLNFTDNNISDAFVLALCGLCIDLDFRSKTEINKSK